MRALPSHAQKPGLWQRKNAATVARQRGVAVDAARQPVVTLMVADNVRDGIDELGRRAQQVRMVMVVEDGAAALHDAVQRLGDPDGQALLESASTTRWRWFPSTENSMMRNPNRSRASAKHCSIAPKHRLLRRFQTPMAMRNVTSSTDGRSNCSRPLCDTRGRCALRLRPAPFRFPPRCGSFNASCFIPI